MAKPNQVTEFRDLSIEELLKCADEVRHTLFALRSKGGIPGNVKPHELSDAKRKLARILTVVQEKQQEA